MGRKVALRSSSCASLVGPALHELSVAPGIHACEEHRFSYLPEPGALKNNETGSEELQHDIVPKDHLYEDAEGPSEHGAQQERVDMLVQGWAVMDVVVEEETCTKQFQPPRIHCFLLQRLHLHCSHS